MTWLEWVRHRCPSVVAHLSCYKNKPQPELLVINICLLLTVLEAGKPKAQVLADLVSAEGCSLCVIWGTTLHTLASEWRGSGRLPWWKQQAALFNAFRIGCILLILWQFHICPLQVSQKWNSHDLINLSKYPYLNSILGCCVPTDDFKGRWYVSHRNLIREKSKVLAWNKTCCIQTLTSALTSMWLHCLHPHKSAMAMTVPT